MAIGQYLLCCRMLSGIRNSYIYKCDHKGIQVNDSIQVTHLTKVLPCIKLHVFDHFHDYISAGMVTFSCTILIYNITFLQNSLQSLLDKFAAIGKQSHELQEFKGSVLEDVSYAFQPSITMQAFANSLSTYFKVFYNCESNLKESLLDVHFWWV